MKKLIKTIFVIFSTLFIVGCGGGNGSMEECDPCISVPTATYIIICQDPANTPECNTNSATVYPGDTLNPHNGIALYNVVDVFGEVYKKVTIHQGSAKLIFGSYSIVTYPRD